MLLNRKTIRDAVAAMLAGFAVYVAGFGVFDTIMVYGITVFLAGMVGFLSLACDANTDTNASWLQVPLNVALACVFAFLIWRWSGIMLEQEEFFLDISHADFRLAWVAFALFGYLTFRFFGLPMFLVYGAALLYAILPDTLGGSDIIWSSISDRQWFTTDGVFGRPVQIVSTIVLVFIVFGAVLQSSGAGEILLKIAFATTGRFSGGPAHASIVASALFGTMSGAAVANVVSTGVFTIPIIKRAGFKAKFAGGVEAAASTGGQIMPPVMGVVAFIMADVTGIPYVHIIIAALIPALFYYLSLFMVVLVEARKQGIGATRTDFREKVAARDWVKSLAFWIPLGTIVFVLLTGRTPQNAGFYALIVVILLCLILFPEFRHPRKWWQALVSAGKVSAILMIIVASVGVVIGIVNMTGIGFAFADSIRLLSGGSIFLALILVMLGCLVMGMGVPSVTAYLILALIMGPVLENLGVAKIAAHMFILYFGVLSAITPPVALAAFAAAPIAGAGPMETSLEAVRLAIAGFLIPFIFVYYPDILIIDGYTILGLARAIICFVLGTWMMATALAGFELTRLSRRHSLLRLVVAVAILTPEPYSTLAGGAVAVALVLSQFARHARHRHPEITPI